MLRFFYYDGYFYCAVEVNYYMFFKKIFEDRGWSYSKDKKVFYYNILFSDSKDIKEIIKNELEYFLKNYEKYVDKNSVLEIANELKKKEENVEVVDFGFLNDVLRDYQKKAYNKYLESNKKLFIVADMGLGKTLMSLSIVVKENAKAVIIVPKSNINDWYRQILKFNIVKENEIFILNTLDNTSKEMLLKNKNGIRFIIFNYDKFYFFDDFYNMFFSDFAKEKTILICDETYKIKNYKSKLYKEAITFRYKVGFDGVILLNGTPFENNLFEYWANIYFLDSKHISKNDMFKFFAIKNNYNYYYTNNVYFTYLAKKYVYRVKKDIIANELPPIIYDYKFVNNTKEAHLFKQKLLSDKDLFTSFVNLRLLDSYYNKDGFVFENLNKVNLLRDILEDLNDEKVIIFTFFEKTANFLKNILSEFKIEVVSGSLSEEEKNKIEDKFLNSDLNIVIATDTWSRGKNFSNVNYLINYDFPLNPAVFLQRVNRIHRLDSSKNTKVVISLISDIIENDVYEIILSKTKNIEKYVEGNFTEDTILQELKRKYNLGVKQ